MQYSPSIESIPDSVGQVKRVSLRKTAVQKRAENVLVTRNEKVEHYITIKTHCEFWVESGVSVLCG